MEKNEVPSAGGSEEFMRDTAFVPESIAMLPTPTRHR